MVVDVEEVLGLWILLSCSPDGLELESDTGAWVEDGGRWQLDNDHRSGYSKYYLLFFSILCCHCYPFQSTLSNVQELINTKNKLFANITQNKLHIPKHHSSLSSLKTVRFCLRMGCCSVSALSKSVLISGRSRLLSRSLACDA